MMKRRRTRQTMPSDIGALSACSAVELAERAVAFARLYTREREPFALFVCKKLDLCWVDRVPDSGDRVDAAWCATFNYGSNPDVLAEDIADSAGWECVNVRGGCR